MELEQMKGKVEAAETELQIAKMGLERAEGELG